MGKIIDLLNEGFDVGSMVEKLNAQSVIASMLVATLCGAIIYLTYRIFYRGVVYSDNFNILLVLVCEITAFIIMTISSNLVLSLGMVGALSIVRFRAAVKDPLDVGFLFWAVSVGLTAGARLYSLALTATLFIALVYIILTFVKKDKRCYLLVLRYSPDADEGVNKALADIRYKLKNKTTTQGLVELTVEIRAKGNDASVLDKFKVGETVESAVLLEYSGDYAN